MAVAIGQRDEDLESISMEREKAFGSGVIIERSCHSLPYYTSFCYSANGNDGRAVLGSRTLFSRSLRVGTSGAFPLAGRTDLFWFYRDCTKVDTPGTEGRGKMRKDTEFLDHDRSQLSGPSLYVDVNRQMRSSNMYPRKNGTVLKNGLR